MNNAATTQQQTPTNKRQTAQEMIAANIQNLIKQLEAGHSDALTATEAIITEGSDLGTIHKVWARASCPVHHPKQLASRHDETAKAEQEKQRREQAVANGLCVLAAISAAVPVRLMERELLFILGTLVSIMEENRLETLARQHGLHQRRDDGGVGKTLSAYFRRANEGTLSRLLV